MVIVNFHFHQKNKNIICEKILYHEKKMKFILLMPKNNFAKIFHFKIVLCLSLKSIRGKFSTIDI